MLLWGTGGVYVRCSVYIYYCGGVGGVIVVVVVVVRHMVYDVGLDLF